MTVDSAAIIRGIDAARSHVPDDAPPCDAPGCDRLGVIFQTVTDSTGMRTCYWCLAHDPEDA